MATTLPVPAPHLIEGFSKGIDQQGPFYKVVYKIDSWSQTDNFCNTLMGFGSSTGSGGNVTVSRGVPHAHPLSPNLYCMSATVVQGLGNPITNSNGYPNYDGGALISAEYRPSPFNFGPGGGGYDLNNQIDQSTPLAWCTQKLSHSTETITVKPADTDRNRIAASIQVPITILTLTFHKLPYLPVAAIRSLRGKVNSTTFLGSTAGTVLFKGGDTDRQWNTDGSAVQEVQLTFHERPAAFPWNSAPSKDAPYTWAPVTDVNGNKPFLIADLNPLVQF